MNKVLSVLIEDDLYIDFDIDKCLKHAIKVSEDYGISYNTGVLIVGIEQAIKAMEEYYAAEYDALGCGVRPN